MNSNEPMMENASEYWKIIDNLRDSKEQLEKELIQLKAMMSNSFEEVLPDSNTPTSLQTNNDTLSDYNFTLIINQLNNVVYADMNGLKLLSVIQVFLLS